MKVSLDVRVSRRTTKVTAVLLATCIGFASTGSGFVSVAEAAPGAPSATKVDLKSHYQAGETKFKAGDYEGALADFKIVDDAKPTPQSARYVALCNDKLGKFTDAAPAFDRFLAGVGDLIEKQKDDKKKAALVAQRDEAKKRVDEIRKIPGKIHVVTNPAGANVLVDGQQQAAVTPTDVDVPVGKHAIRITAEGREPADRELDVAFASKQDLNIELMPKVDAPPPPPAEPVAATPIQAPPPPPPPPASLVPAYITGGLAIVAAGFGTAFGIAALNNKSDFDKNPTQQTADDGNNHALISDMAFGVAVTLGVTSAVLFLTRDTPKPATPAAKSNDAKHAAAFTITPSPIVTPHGGGAGALVRF